MDPFSFSGPPGIRAHLLGQTRLFLGDRPIPDDAWPRRAMRSLLLLLLATPGHRLPRDQVIDQLWPDASPKTGLNALYVSLHGLRRVLEPKLRSGRDSAYLELLGDVVRLRPEAIEWIDVEAFLAAASNSGAVDRREQLAAALALYTGDLLADEPYVDWPIARRQHLRSAWRDAALAYADLEGDEGRPHHAAAALERINRSDPTDEPVARALMRALAAAGRREDALRQYDRFRQALETELGIRPGAETEALRTAIAESPPLPGAGTGFPTPQPPNHARFDNLPAPPNPLIGRTRELEDIQDLLSDPYVRLVTVTGPGGIGKTRLALEAAAQIADDFSAGACFVALAPIRDPDLVLPTIAWTLGIEETAGRTIVESLREALRDRSMLFVLDNMEQLVESAPAVADLIASFPRLKIMVTSREPLRVRAEHVFSLPTLATPRVEPAASSRRITAGGISRFEAVSLFAARAQAVEASFALTEENAGAVAAICARLDGLPLAIELAAARSRHLTPAQLQTRLTKRLPVLTGGPRDMPPRQQTMRDAIAWSYDLLTDDEQAHFRQLSVFVGGFTLDAAAAVDGADGGDGARAIDLVASLVDKSLIQREEEETGRFGVLETIREYGTELLGASGAGAATRRSHAAYFTALAEAAAPLLHGAAQSSWLDRLDDDHDNIRAALNWACEQEEEETALRLGGALAEFWKMRGHLREGRAWLERALLLASDAPSAPRARALEGSGNLARTIGDNEPALDRLSRALHDWRALGERRGEGTTLGSLAAVAAAKGDYRQAVELNQEALHIFEEIGDRPGLAEALNRLGIIAMDQGDHAQATDLYNRSLALYRDLAHRHGEARVLNNLGTMAFWRADYHRAVEFHEESLSLWRALGDRLHAAVVLANLGEDLRAGGDLDRAIAIAAEGLQLSRELGDKRSTATALFIMGSLFQHERADPRAVAPLVEGLLLYQQTGDRLGMAWCLEALAGPAAAAGQPDLAARLCGASDLLREAVQVPLQPAERPAYDRHMDAARAALGDDAFAQFRSLGRATPLETTIAEAAAFSVQDGGKGPEPICRR